MSSATCGRMFCLSWIVRRRRSGCMFIPILVIGAYILIQMQVHRRSTKSGPLVVNSTLPSLGHSLMNAVPQVTNVKEVEKPNVSTSVPLEGVRQVILLTYQKSGSSFLGELFNQNKEAFFWFEPLDGAYSELYGIGHGWTVPSDITIFSNRSYKSPSKHELDVVHNTLGGLLSCDFRTVPNDVFLHFFMRFFYKLQKNLEPFLACTSKTRKIFRCREHTKLYCGKRYGENPVAMETCRRYLPWNYTAEQSVGEAVHDRSPLDTSRLKQSERRTVPRREKFLSDSMRKAFNDTRKCKAEERKKIFDCVPELKKKCEPGKIRSIKTIRLTMHNIPRLLEDFPNLRVIHFYRDPRAVALSRKGHSSFRSFTSGSDLVKEAQLYCQTVTEDIRLRRKLQNQFPDNFMELTFEELAEFPLETARKVYSKIQLELPQSVEVWLKENTGGEKIGGKTARNASLVLQKWRETLSFSTVREINQVCSDLYSLVEPDWPGLET